MAHPLYTYIQQVLEMLALFGHTSFGTIMDGLKEVLKNIRRYIKSDEPLCPAYSSLPSCPSPRNGRFKANSGDVTETGCCTMMHEPYVSSIQTGNVNKIIVKQRHSVYEA
jgi:hypothetical protein